MQESKNSHFFNAKEKDMEKLLMQNYGTVKHWNIDPFATLASNPPPSDSLSKRQRRKYMESIRSNEINLMSLSARKQQTVDGSQHSETRSKRTPIKSMKGQESKSKISHFDSSASKSPRLHTS